MLLKLFRFFFFIFPFILWGQTFKEISFPVYEGSQLIPQPFTGGWKCPQFSETDLNKDGISDIYVFDRVGNIHGAYIGKKKVTGSDKVEYVLAPEFVAHFPNAESWVLLKDYDKDGISDFFAYSDVPGVDGIQVWKGFYDLNNNGSLSYDEFLKMVLPCDDKQLREEVCGRKTY